MLYITIWKFKHLRYLIKTKQLDVKNSPIDRIASAFSKLFSAIEVVAPATIPIIGCSATLMGVDESLKWIGREPIIGPYIGNKISTLLPISDNTSDVQYHLNKIQSNNDLIKENHRIGELFCNHKDLFSKEELSHINTELNKFKEGIEL